MQGALAGGIGLAIGSIRNIVSLRYTQTPVLVGFVFINVAFCIWEWLVLESPAILFIAYASALVFTVGTIVLKSAEAIRKWFIVAELLGLIYAALVGSVFGVLFNISNLTSIVVKLVQESKKDGKAQPVSCLLSEGFMKKTFGGARGGVEFGGYRACGNAESSNGRRGGGEW